MGRHCIVLIPTEAEQRSLEERYPTGEISYHELATYYLPAHLGCFLDFGCGKFALARLMVGRYEAGFGVDVVNPAVAPPERFRFEAIGVGERVPFPDESFDTIAIVEVIEHVPDERAVLAELERMLRPGGTMVLTTPHRGLLTWIDPGNWKFHFPRLHRWVHVTVMNDRDGYERRFGSLRPNGLIGNISGPCHRHYRVGEIAALLPRMLVITRVRVSYPAMRLVWVLGIVRRLLPKSKWLDRAVELRWIRSKLSRQFGSWGDQMVLVITKVK